MNSSVQTYTKSRFQPVRRKTLPVQVGPAVIGGDAPILLQSMTTTSTKDVEATTAQALRLVEGGCQLVRITAPTAADAVAMSKTIAALRVSGCAVPVSADIHFQPRAAFEAVKCADKVRINPGNFVDSGILTLKELSDEEFADGVRKVREAFAPLVDECAQRGVALRIGTNHGSLSARMLFRHGDTIEGMVESALEFLAVCEDKGFDQVVFSMKASSPRVAIQAYRLLAARLDGEGHKPYPLHVGVTEAGDGEDGRLKSAVGIGALLLDGLGDTIRVSLTEDPVNEIPVAEELVRVCTPPADSPFKERKEAIDFYHYSRRLVDEQSWGPFVLGGNEPVRIGVALGSGEIPPTDAQGRSPEWTEIAETGAGMAPWPCMSFAEYAAGGSSAPVEIQLSHPDEVDRMGSLSLPARVLWSWVGRWPVQAYRAIAAELSRLGRRDPMVLRFQASETQGAKLLVAAQAGSLLCDGIGDALFLQSQGGSRKANSLAWDILQACGLRRSKTEFISCPGCGRTLFELEGVLAAIKARTGHLKGVSIAVMGCIVNGPGEMADADFGYVGGAPGHISLYEGKTLVQKNIPQARALDALVELIRSRGRWTDPPSV